MVILSKGPFDQPPDLGALDCSFVLSCLFNLVVVVGAPPQQLVVVAVLQTERLVDRTWIGVIR